jgi:hypothetical protein
MLRSTAARVRLSAPTRGLFSATRPAYNEGERPPQVTAVSRGDVDMPADASSRASPRATPAAPRERVLPTSWC